MKGTIKSSNEISLLFDSGKRINTTRVVALVSDKRGPLKKTQNEQGGRIAVVAGKRLGNAPQRNRAKRRIREAARVEQAFWAGFDVVLIAKGATNSADFSKIVKDMNLITAGIKKIEDGRIS